jgi:hypothetical protein
MKLKWYAVVAAGVLAAGCGGGSGGGESADASSDSSAKSSISSSAASSSSIAASSQGTSSSAQSSSASSMSSGNGAEIAWMRLFGGEGADFAEAVAVDDAGNVYVTGKINSELFEEQVLAGEHQFVRKLSSQGDVLWTQLFEGSGTAIALDAQGFVIVGGSTTAGFEGASNAGETDGVIAKFDAEGNRIWLKLLGGVGSDYISGLDVDADGNIYIGGTTSALFGNEPAQGENDVFIAKLDGSGEAVWMTSLGGASNEFCSGLSLDEARNVYIVGASKSAEVTGSGGSLYKAYVAKYDFEGNNVWISAIGAGDDVYAYAIDTDASGNAYITGSDEHYNGDIFAAKYAPEGSLLWKASYEGRDNVDSGQGIAVADEDEVYITGNVASSEFNGEMITGLTDTMVAKIGEGGLMVWSRLFGGESREFGWGIAVDASGNLLLAGSTVSETFEGESNHGGSDAFVMKLN